MDILGVHPYYMCGTGLYAAKKASLNAPHPKTVIADSLKCLGNTMIGYPYYFHAVMGWGFRNLDPMPTGARMLKMMKVCGGVQGGGTGMTAPSRPLPRPLLLFRQANAKRAAAREKKA